MNRSDPPSECRNRACGRQRLARWACALALALTSCATPPTVDASAENAPESMSTTPPHGHHTIDYIEFTVSDLAEAKRFYTAAFGWQFTDYGPDYAGIQRDGGGEVGGIHQAPDARLGGPLVVLYSNDLAESVRAVQAAGGRIVKEPFDFPGGRRFHFTDPAGNELAVWSDQ